MLDRDGSVRRCVERTSRADAGRRFEELEAACFPGRDGELSLFALSPRHLEACATRTAQILVEGEYSGVLRPGEHYLELRRDLSNLDDVLDLVADGRSARTRSRPRARGHRRVRPLHLPAAGRGRRARAPGRRAAAGRRSAALSSHAVDTASRPLIPLATRVVMPARRRVLGARVGGYEAEAHPRAPRRQSAGCWCSTTGRSAAVPGRLDRRRARQSFGRHSRLGVVELNTHAGIPPALCAAVVRRGDPALLAVRDAATRSTTISRLPARDRRVQGRVLPG